MTTIESQSFGTTSSGEAVTLYTLTNQSGMAVKISTYGGAIVSCVVPDKNGHPVDVVLGYDSVAQYEKQDKYIGSLVGRHANRIENAEFILNGKRYPLYANNGRNHLHGGKVGFDKKVWRAISKNGALALTYISPNGEEGYPGTLTVTVTYSIDEQNTLSIDYHAVSDQDTVCNLTNHSYFNLDGHDSGNVLAQSVQLFCDYYTQANAESLPDGTILPVAGTPMDLRTPCVLGNNIDSDFPQLKQAGGYDNNWIINSYDGALRKAAMAFGATSGIVMTVFTTLPGLQFYSGNFLDGTLAGKNNTFYNKRDGFCLETQFFPNALLHDNFLQPILRQSEVYHQKTCYQFSV